jgi:hypothetical protein
MGLQRAEWGGGVHQHDTKPIPPPPPRAPPNPTLQCMTECVVCGDHAKTCSVMAVAVVAYVHAGLYATRRPSAHARPTQLHA